MTDRPVPRYWTDHLWDELFARPESLHAKEVVLASDYATLDATRQRLAEQLGDEQWMHAACLTIAETGQKWGENIHPSPAMVATWELYNEQQRLEERVQMLEAEAGYHEAKDAIQQLTTQRDEALAKLAQANEHLAEARQAIGLATTCIPSMVLDVEHPLEMMQRVCDHLAQRENREIELGRAITAWIAAHNDLKAKLSQAEQHMVEVALALKNMIREWELAISTTDRNSTPADTLEKAKAVLGMESV